MIIMLESKGKCPRCNRFSEKVVRGYCPSCYHVLRIRGIIKTKTKVPIKFTSRQTEIINGFLLGDGCIFAGKHALHNRLIVIRSQKDIEYLKWQYEEFRNFYNSPPNSYKQFDKRTNKYYYYCNLSTRSSLAFDYLREKWYINNKKVVPKDLILTPLIIAIWFCDDGSCRFDKKGNIRGLKFSTDGFDKIYVEFLADLLSKRYNEYFGVCKNGNNWTICTYGNGSEKLLDDIREYIPQSMDRKFLKTGRKLSDKTKKKISDKKRGIVNPKASISNEISTLIISLRNTGKTLQEISAYLDNMDIKPLRNKKGKWQPNVIYRVLKKQKILNPNMVKYTNPKAVELEIINLIVSLRKSCLSYREIKEKLESYQIKPKNVATWTISNIRGIFKRYGKN